MNFKRKLTAAALVVAFGATAITGVTLAYFTDTDAADNTFTVGNVDISLDETFTQDSKLIPATGSAQAGTLKNGVQKEVRVKNENSNDAYVRVHIAIPSILDSGDPEFDAGKNVLHFNFASDSLGENKWDWSKTTGAPYDSDWNYYTTEIAGVSYNVYVVTYERILKANEMTENAIHQVYLDSKVTSADMEKINAVLGKNWHMYVAAEGAQAEGFNNAYEALNTAFGTPGTYDVKWTAEVTN